MINLFSIQQAKEFFERHPHDWHEISTRGMRRLTSIRYHQIYRLERLGVIPRTRRAENKRLFWTMEELDELLTHLERYFLRKGPHAER